MEYLTAGIIYIKKGIWQLFIGSFLIFLFYYILIWSILEPLQFDFTSDLPFYRKILLLTCFILTTTSTLLILHFSSKQTFSLLENDENIISSLTVTKGNPTNTIIIDRFYGNAIKINSEFSKDLQYCELKATAKSATKVTYYYLPDRNLSVYLRLTLYNLENSREQKVWIYLRDDAATVIDGTSDYEKAFPIVAKNENENWLKVEIDILKVFEETYSRLGFAYRRIEGFQLSGSGNLYKISFS